MYDPKIARFLQEDTYRGQANDPLSLNYYTYCSNNPVVYWDPSGHRQMRMDDDRGGNKPIRRKSVKKASQAVRAIPKNTSRNMQQSMIADLIRKIPKIGPKMDYIFNGVSDTEEEIKRGNIEAKANIAQVNRREKFFKNSGLIDDSRNDDKRNGIGYSALGVAAGPVKAVGEIISSGKQIVSNLGDTLYTLGSIPHNALKDDDHDLEDTVIAVISSELEEYDDMVTNGDDFSKSKYWSSKVSAWGIDRLAGKLAKNVIDKKAKVKVDAKEIVPDNFEKNVNDIVDEVNDGNKVSVKGTGNLVFQKGFDAHLIDVEDVVWKKGKGIVGGHNLNNFEDVFISNDWSLDEYVLSRKPHPTIKGIYEIEYQLPAKDAAQNFVEGQYKKIAKPKTVYAPSVVSDAQMIEWGKEAMNRGVVNGRVITGTASNGLKFTGFVNDVTGEITNFYPTLK